ncbi:D-isomer specific 2-hydroxyacid dehydrogenase [Rhexocercosporidium sp. MPI-PUGE-AT-0058]|nr:D-isomer specific 2-hydroxyacid dehydrogenase [Rhexocercosporidium sp. MPI-PUGE-AT-0058]
MAVNQPVQIAILDDYQGVGFQHFQHLHPAKASIITFKDTLPSFSHSENTQHDRDLLITRLQPFEVLIAMRERTPFPAQLLEMLPNLKLILTAGTRNGAIDIAAAARRGIAVAGSPGYGRSHQQNHSTAMSVQEATTEHAWALILGLAKNLVHDHQATVSGAWQRDGLSSALKGRTLGILGLGRLGAAVARVGKFAFSMNVIAWSTNLTQEAADQQCEILGLPAEDARGMKTFQVVSKSDLFKLSDVLTVHYVLSERSRNIVSEEDLLLMKASSLFINTSRAPLVNETALIEVLRKGSIRGAAIDVFNCEPLPANSLWSTIKWGHHGTARVILSPHKGYAVEEVLYNWYEAMAENLELWLQGKELNNQLRLR